MPYNMSDRVTYIRRVMDDQFKDSLQRRKQIQVTHGNALNITRRLGPLNKVKQLDQNNCVTKFYSRIFDFTQKSFTI